MKIIYRNVKPADLTEIVPIEAQAFNMSEEMTKRDMVGRIENYPDTFLVAEDNDTNKIAGYVFGPAFKERYTKDEIYFKNHPNYQEDKYQMILSLVVAPAYRHRGIASHLLSELSQVAKRQNRSALSLTCLKELIPFYEKNGYQNEGETVDIPGETTYNMVKEI